MKRFTMFSKILVSTLVIAMIYSSFAIGALSSLSLQNVVANADNAIWRNHGIWQHIGD